MIRPAPEVENLTMRSMLAWMEHHGAWMHASEAGWRFYANAESKTQAAYKALKVLHRLGLVEKRTILDPVTGPRFFWRATAGGNRRRRAHLVRR